MRHQMKDKWTYWEDESIDHDNDRHYHRDEGRRYVMRTKNAIWCQPRVRGSCSFTSFIIERIQSEQRQQQLQKQQQQPEEEPSQLDMWPQLCNNMCRPGGPQLGCIDWHVGCCLVWCCFVWFSLVQFCMQQQLCLVQFCLWY